jgi:hypothetical protein
MTTSPASGTWLQQPLPPEPLQDPPQEEQPPLCNVLISGIIYRQPPGVVIFYFFLGFVRCDGFCDGF